MNKKVHFSGNVSLLCTCSLFHSVIYREGGLPNMKRLEEFRGVSVIVSAVLRA
jgi:hypothetical protein